MDYQAEIDSIPKAPDPKDEEKKFLDAFAEWWEEDKKFKEPVKKMMEHAFISYRSILSDFHYSQRNFQQWGLAVFVPLTFQVVSSIEAQLNGRPPQYRVGPANNPSDLETAEFISKISQSEYRRAEAQKRIAEATQESLIFGITFLRSTYRYDVRKKKFIKEVNKETSKPVYEERDHTFYKGWAPIIDHPLKVYLPPVYEHDPQKWPRYTVRDVVDYRTLKAYYEAHPELAYEDNYKYLAPGGDTHDDLEILNKFDVLYRLPNSRYPGSYRELVGQVFPLPTNTGPAARKNMVEIWRVFSQETDEWAVVANCGRGKGILLEYHPNPLEDTKELPVVAMRDYQIANWPWALGEPDIIRWLQFEANSLHNLGLDSTKYSVGPIFGVNSSMLDDDDEIEIYPGRIIHMKNIPGLTMDSAIKTLNVPEVKNSIFKMIGLNEDIIRKTTGAGTSVIGGAGEDEGSATGTNAIKAATEARIYEKARKIEQECVKDMIRHQLSFMAQFYDEEMVFKITDQEFFKFFPGTEADRSASELEDVKQQKFEGVIFGDDLAKGYDVFVEGESTLPLNRQQRQVQAMQLLKLSSEVRRAPTQEELKTNPNLPTEYPQGLPVLDAETITKEILLPTYNILDNKDRYVWHLQGQGPDRKRSPGRPEDVVGNAAEEIQNPSPPADQAAMLSNAQPANLGINAGEQAVV